MLRTLLLVLMLSVFSLSTAYAQLDPGPNCVGAPLPRLIVGNTARVVPGDANNVRDTPSASGTRIGQIAGGEVFTVLDGPVCDDEFNWWQVEYGELVGWTVEGTLEAYWIEPYEVEEIEVTPAPQATATKAPPAEPIRSFEPPLEVVNVLAVGERARVINDDPNAETITLVVRSEPSRSAGAVAQALEGDLLTIIGGPEEADGLRWWQVETAKGSQGWVIEGLVNTERDNFYERTLLPVCTAEGERVAFRLGDFVMTSAPDGSALCVFDYIHVPAWQTFSKTLFNFNNVFLTAPDNAFFVYADGPLYRLSRDGSERLILTQENIYWASLSPNGERIAIATGANIATFNNDGSRYATLTQGESIRLWVEWLSDSETLVYSEQSDYLDQMGIAIEYTFYRVNTQQGGLRPIVELPLGFDLSDVALSPVTDRLAISGGTYELLDGMRGSESVKFLDLGRAIDSLIRVVDADSGEVALEQSDLFYGLWWMPDGQTLLAYSVENSGDVIISVATGEVIPLTLRDETSSDISRYFLAWESETTYLVYSGYGFKVSAADFGIWSVDIANGTVTRLR